MPEEQGTIELGSVSLLASFGKTNKITNSPQVGKVQCCSNLLFLFQEIFPVEMSVVLFSRLTYLVVLFYF